jgi:hypothetical protein
MMIMMIILNDKTKTKCGYDDYDDYFLNEKKQVVGLK